ncbi:tetraacyldisaccharide 4'-kinase [Polaribacter sp. KT 15]|uniref:tetraacyldisaccharide 4'-kinase n=1 Tax=Polaribacter sp. KT 15 TaxID=1896175 RepID=UPI000909A279|nr:tetraacyldisaccharide 4'-kinase [Polaribacter sp. KT 15]SHN01929.1 lipid-A-disaccharide kinase [Polaribacter sp. KT 15]
MKVLRFFLFPFAILYDFVTKIRNLFFDVGVFKETSFKTPIIVVGNLSVGGTGKTPQIEYLIRLLQNRYKTAVLSRGYKRLTKGFVLVRDNHNAIDVGDEPLQYFKKFKAISVAVDANRVAGVTKLINEQNAEVVLLDDAFQHRKVKGSFNILLTKFNDLFVDDFLLPTGNLRESKTGAKRADVILVTKCPNDLDQASKAKVLKKLKKFDKEVFFTTISYGNKILGSKEFSTTDIANYEVLLITGIANPKPFLEFLSNLNVNFKHLEFADHHHFSEKEINDIKNNFDSLPSNKLLLTTEKDYVRLHDKLSDLCYLPIETLFLNDSKNKFDTLINSHLKEKV